ncbi:MAG: peptidoglycan-N-acetylglucosamine deacetylase [Solirubrobacteraceae bacterium]|nr:peptidoglycan-N-acetylglucosamine deacetylase [Solirubrobacteraceae bacterium]
MSRRSTTGWIRFLLICASVLSVSPVYGLAGEVPAMSQSGSLVLLRVGPIRHGPIVATITRSRVVALSIDDGPDPRFTPAILATLRAHAARATFFAVGANAIAHPELIRNEVRSGNEVANHTLDHPHLSRLGLAATRRELDLGRRALIAAGSPEPRLLRAPFGEFTPRLMRAAASRGELSVSWSLTVERALDGRSIRAAVGWLMRRVRPGAILLAHDGLLDRSRTVKALPLLLDQLVRRGYRVVTVSELLYASGNLAVRRLLAPPIWHGHAVTTTGAGLRGPAA